MNPNAAPTGPSSAYRHHRWEEEASEGHPDPLTDVHDRTRTSMLMYLKDLLKDEQIDTCTLGMLWTANLAKLNEIICLAELEMDTFFLSKDTSLAVDILSTWFNRRGETSLLPWVSKEVLARENKCCMVAKSQMAVQERRIHPRLMGARRDFWWLKLAFFYNTERVVQWRDAARNPEECHNMLALEMHVADLWHRARIGFKPIKMHENNRVMEVQIYWLPNCGYSASEPIDKMPPLPFLEAPEFIKKVDSKEIRSGDTLFFRTSDPVKSPLPPMALMDMQWTLNRAAAMSGSVSQFGLPAEPRYTGRSNVGTKPTGSNGSSGSDKKSGGGDKKPGGGDKKPGGGSGKTDDDNDDDGNNDGKPDDGKPGGGKLDGGKLDGQKSDGQKPGGEPSKDDERAGGGKPGEQKSGGQKSGGEPSKNDRKPEKKDERPDTKTRKGSFQDFFANPLRRLSGNGSRKGSANPTPSPPDTDPGKEPVKQPEPDKQTDKIEESRPEPEPEPKPPLPQRPKASGGFAALRPNPSRVLKSIRKTGKSLARNSKLRKPFKFFAKGQ